MITKETKSSVKLAIHRGQHPQSVRAAVRHPAGLPHSQHNLQPRRTDPHSAHRPRPPLTRSPPRDETKAAIDPAGNVLNVCTSVKAPFLPKVSGWEES